MQLKRDREDEAHAGIGDIAEIFRDARIGVKNINHSLDRILMGDGSAASILLSADQDERREINIFDYNINTYARVEFSPKQNLPVRFRILTRNT